MIFNKIIGSNSSDKALRYVAVATANSPYIEVYSFSPSGFGSKFSNPASLPSGTLGGGSTSQGLAFSPDGTFLICGIDTTTDPRYSLYPFSSSGFGSKLSNQITGLPCNRSYAFRPSGKGLAVGLNSGGSMLTMRGFSNTGIGSAYSSPPSVFDSNTGQSVAVSPLDDAVVVGYSISPFVAAARLTSSGYGLPYSAPSSAIIATNYIFDVSFSPSGDSVILLTDSSPYIQSYSWTSASGFGSKFSNPASPLARSGESLSFTPSGDYLAISQGTNGIYIYPWSDSTGFGSRAITASPGGFVYDVAFSRDGKYLAVAHASSPFISIYNWTGTSVGSKISNPSSLPSGACYSVALF